MPIIPPGHGPWRSPSADEPFVSMHRTNHGDYEVTVRPGADGFDLARVLVTLPMEAVFTEAFGDVETILIFRTPTGTRVPAPAGAPTADGNGNGGSATSANPQSPAGWVPQIPLTSDTRPISATVTRQLLAYVLAALVATPGSTRGVPGGARTVPR
ncbi:MULTISPECIES: hypothetical protein [unclassified Frankia]|uniref:hypothetical protein n=1 Tax=unclassified Frankia TaxID=2632575 RepID=UPI002AD2FBC6|nr:MULTISPECIES: hypothetical protein [unclassified Frankia]